MIRIINYISIILVVGLVGFNIYSTLSTVETAKPLKTGGQGQAQSQQNIAGAVPANYTDAESGWMLETERNNIELFKATQASVVHVTNNRFYRNFFSLDVTAAPQGTGTGIMWSRDGLVLTNYHVVAKANQVLVKLHGKEVYEAELVGLDPDKDIALLKIDAPADQLKPIRLGSSRTLRVGQKVLAIGNPFGLDQTLTVGVISALGREIKSPSGVPIKGVIQTDAAINPGNSGGPLLNSRGELIGINTQIYSSGGGSVGIGFAIPIDKASSVINMLVKYGKVVRPYLGVVALDSQVASYYDLEGAVVKDVEPGSPADRAGIQGITMDRGGRNFYLGDIIVSMGGTPIREADELLLELEKYSPGDRVEITTVRKTEKKTLSVVLGDLR